MSSLSAYATTASLSSYAQLAALSAYAPHSTLGLYALKTDAQKTLTLSAPFTLTGAPPDAMGIDLSAYAPMFSVAAPLVLANNGTSLSLGNLGAAAATHVYRSQ